MIVRPIHSQVMTQVLLAVFLALTFCLLGCQGYSGDGELSYFEEPGYLYTVDLGPIDLTKPSKYQYELVGLPKFTVVWLNLGLQVTRSAATSGSGPLWQSRPLPNVVHMKLIASDNGMVIDQVAPLREWRWSAWGDEPDRAYLYRAGKEMATKVDETTTRYTPDGFLAHGGWGTYVHEHRPEERYQLTLEVKEGADIGKDFRVRLQVRAWTWLLDGF